MVRIRFLLAALIVLPLAAASRAGEPLKVAVVGLVHGHAWGHLSELQKSDEARLVGVSEPNRALVDVARERGVAGSLFFDDYRRMLDQTKPEVVWSFVENNRHLEIARECAARHISVIFEKPLASTYADAAAIRDLARRSGIFVMTNYQMAWWPTNAEGKKLADGGTLGSVYELRGTIGHGGPSSEGPTNHAFFEWLTDPVKNGGGAIVDFGCYGAAWSLWYLGMPETVYARAYHLQPARFPQVEDRATIDLGYKRGNMYIDASWDLPRPYQDLEVIGRSGSLLMTQKQVLFRRGNKNPVTEPVDPLPADRASPLAAMIHALHTHTEPAGITGLDLNVQVMQVIEAAKKSVETGAVVPLN